MLEGWSQSHIFAYFVHILTHTYIFLQMYELHIITMLAYNEIVYIYTYRFDIFYILPNLTCSLIAV